MRFTKQELVLLGMLAFIQCSHIIDFMIMMPLGPQLMRIFSISPREFGMLISAYTFAAAISGIASAFFMDRYDRKNSLLVFYIGFCIGTVACGLSPNYYTLFAARTLTGMFGGVLGSLVMAIVSDSIAPHKRGEAMGVVMTAFAIASIFGVPLSLFLANQYNWHMPFLALGVLSSALTFVILFFIPPVREHLKRPIVQTPLQTVLGVLEDASPRRALVFLFVIMMGHFSVIPFLSPSLVSNAKMTEPQLPLIYLVGGICTIIMSPLMGRFADRYGRYKVMTISVSLCFIPIYILTNLGPTPLMTILFYIAVFFIFSAGRFGPAMAIVTSTVHPQRRGTFMSLSSCVQNLSSSLGAYIAGLIVTTNAAGELLHYNYVGYFSIVLGTISLIIARKIKMVE